MKKKLSIAVVVLLVILLAGAYWQSQQGGPSESEGLESEFGSELDALSDDLNELKGFETDTSLDSLNDELPQIAE